eukprot:3746083-Karenia_brevis.AAC.1
MDPGAFANALKMTDGNGYEILKITVRIVHFLGRPSAIAPLCKASRWGLLKYSIAYPLVI